MTPRAIILSVAGLAGAATTIWTAVAVALPLLRSDPPPFQGKEGLKQYAQTIEELQKNNRDLQQHQQSTDANVDLMRLDFLEEQLNNARTDLAANPKSKSAQKEVCVLIDKIDRARARNGLPLITLPVACQ